MAPKKDTAPAVEPPKPVLAVEYNGTLYKSMQTAEGARAKADLVGILCPSRRNMDAYSMSGDMYRHYEDSGRRDAIDTMIRNAEEVRGILSRYLDAAKVTTAS